MKKIKLVVAEDHAIVRMGFISLLGSEKDIEIVGEAGDGEEAVAVTQKSNPDVVLMDLVMPLMDGAEATAAIRKIAPTTHILILTTFSDPDDIARALEAGADGVLLKSSDYAEVLTSIRKVAEGSKVVASEVSRMIGDRAPLPELTERQIEILTSMARGLTNADIALQLGITPDGVKFHITSILAKLDAANRSEAISIALRRHLLKI